MDKKYFLILGVLVALVATLVSGCVGEKTVPPTMEYFGTEYKNCAINPKYPTSTDHEKEVLVGVATEELGTRTCPVYGTMVDGKLLFDIDSNYVSFSYHDNLYETVGKTIEVEGYSGGKKEVCNEEYDVFYVTNITSWQNICCDIDKSDMTDVGRVSNIYCFWFEE